MDNTRPKTPSESRVFTRYLLMPGHTNARGTAFGGQIMSWIDTVGSMAAERHCGNRVVTASIDSMSFYEPIHIGDHVLLRACVTYTGRTSMEIAVTVMRETPPHEQQIVANKAYLTFVAVDADGHPVPVPPLVPETELEMTEFQNAQIRVQHRKELREKLEQSRCCE